MSNSAENELNYISECPICFEPLEPPSSQCTNGHLICHVCVKQVTNCPVCRVTMPENPIRNLVVDKMLENTERTCQYEGCKFRLKQVDLKKHMLECSFR